MKVCMAVAALWLTCSVTQIVAADDTIRPSQDIDKVSKLMQRFGYQEAGLDMAPRDKDTDLKMWAVGEGVLIFTVSTKDKKVLHITYFLCDERAKASRKEYRFQVSSFDPKIRAVTIMLPNEAPEATR